MNYAIVQLEVSMTQLLTNVSHSEFLVPRNEFVLTLGTLANN